MDVFHAIQRVTSKIPKYHHECLKALQLVFRDPSAQRPTRTKGTPPPDVLQRQMCKFKEVWEKVGYYGKQILPPAAVKEFVACWFT